MSGHQAPEIQVLGPGAVLVTGLAAVETMHLINAGYRAVEKGGTRHLERFRLIRNAFRTAHAWAEMSRGRHDDTENEGVQPDSEMCEDGDLLSAADAAEMIGVTVRHVQRMAPTSGGFLVSGRWVFDRSAVLALKAQRQQRNEDRHGD